MRLIQIYIVALQLLQYKQKYALILQLGDDIYIDTQQNNAIFEN